MVTKVEGYNLIEINGVKHIRLFNFRVSLIMPCDLKKIISQYIMKRYSRLHLIHPHQNTIFVRINHSGKLSTWQVKCSDELSVVNCILG